MAQARRKKTAAPSVVRRKKRPAAEPPKVAEKPREPRRALSHVGGQVVLGGDDAALHELLVRALNVAPEESTTQAHVHGFHSYPARLHPETAARLIEGLTKPRDVVLDPFCGSGTVLIEAQRLGRAAIGVDANPLAVALSRLRTRRPEPRWGDDVMAAVARIVERADARRREKAGPTKRYGAADRELFDIHVLLELDGLKSGIALETNDVVRRSLLLVLSATLTKVSKKAGDSSERVETKRIASGFTLRFFETKARELVERVIEYRTLVPRDTPEPEPRAGDARRPPVKPGTVHAVITSPPYPGVYDYLAHHEARLRWLGMDDRRFAETEIGARRELSKLDYSSALRTWKSEFGDVLAALRRCLVADGRVALILGDSTLAGRAVHADRVVAEIAPRAGLEVLAAAAQDRPHFHFPSRGAFHARPRREHVLVLGPR